MNTFQLIVAIAFGMFFGRVLDAMFGYILELATQKNTEQREAERMEEVRKKAQELSEIISLEINKANPNINVQPIKDGKGVKVNGKENTSKRKRV